MSRGLHMFLAIILISQTIFTSLGFGVIADAEGKSGEMIKDVTVSAEESGAVEVKVDWSTKGLDVEADNEETFHIPEEINIEEAKQGDLQVEEEVIGAFSVTLEGAVTVAFNEKASDYPEAGGTFSFAGVVEVVDEDTEYDGNPEDTGESEADKLKADGEVETEDLNEDKSERSETSKEASENKDEPAQQETVEKNDEEKEANNPSKQAMKANDEGKSGFKLALGKITDLDDEEFSKQHPMDPHKEFKVKLDWELEDGHTYVEGDAETFDLPKGIKVNEEISIELKDEHGQVIAHAVVTPDKKVELTFTKFVEGHSSVKGWMEVISGLDEEEVKIEDEEVVFEPIGEEGELRIPIERENKDKTIEKSGTPYGYNADEIAWEVIVNKNKTSLSDAKVTDVLPEGTEYKDGSLKVTKLKVDLNGNVLGDGAVVEITPEVNEEGELTIPLGDTNDAYRVEYVTTVTDEKGTNFTNKATITDAELEDVSAESTITINRGDSLKKGAVKDYDPKTGIIEWYLEFNYNQKDLTDVTLADNWTPADKVGLVDGSVSFQEMEIDGDGKANPVGDPVDVPEGATLNKIDGGFEVSGITTDKPYRVVYQTKVTDRQLEGFRMENLASFDGNKAENGYNIGQYIGGKSAGNIDYAEKTIEWTIKVNTDHRQMNDVMIEDTIGEGLTLIDDSINMTIGGQPKTDFKLENGNPFKLTNIGDTDKEIVVTYKTTFDADKVPNHIAKNKAAITWIPEGEEDRITKDVEAETELNNHTQNNDWKNGSYNPETKEITWEIITNYRENDIANLIVKDIPQGNQQIIDGSAVVKELNIAANGNITEGDTVDGVATIDENANTLEVNIGDTNKAYKIIYKTSLAGLDNMQDEYVNKAEVLDGENSLSEIDAKVGVVQDRKYGDKSGYQDGKQIHWSIDVNVVQQKVNDLKLVDTISENQAYLEDSIKVYHAIMGSDGKVSKGEEVPADEYDLTIEENEFTVEWKNEVEHAFIVDYSTLFFEKHNGTVRNDYVITGDSIEESDQDASDGANVSISQLGSGGGEGTAGYLVIDKIDTTNGGEEKLAGAAFDLIDPETGEVLKSGVTDGNGQIDFGRLLFGDYQLKETKVPEGYVTPEAEQTITIDQAYNPGDDKQAFAYTVENYKPIFAIELLKTDASDEEKVLAGAEFTLFDAEDNELEKATTDNAGKILFDKLERAGTYYVQETKAPAGYELDDTKHEVTVGDKEKEPVQISIDNEQRNPEELTTVSGEKTWLDDDAESRPSSITVNLLANGKKVDATEVTAEDGWKYEFTKLDKNEQDGSEITYTVEEEAVEGYKTTIKGFDITNLRVDTTEVSVNKSWKDDDSEDRPDTININLLQNGELYKEYEVKEENDWKLTISDLPKYDEAGKAYEYSVTEHDVAGYESKVDGFDITNTRTANKNIELTKTWLDDDAQDRPGTIEVELFRSTEKGEKESVETYELTAGNNWSLTVENLPTFDEDGKAYTYVIDETAVTGYESSINGFDITNLRVDTTEVDITKSWKDDDSEDRPDTININLLQNGELYKEYEVKEENDWKLTISDLPKYDEAGKAYEYSVTEHDVAGYESKVDGFDITNTRTETKDIEMTKTWVDTVETAARPDAIEVDLFRSVADGAKESVKTYEVSAANDWKLEVNALPSFDADGKAYTYEIEERAVKGYKTNVNGFDISNVRVGEIVVEGTKTWLDDDAEDRPKSITVHLLANGKEVDSTEITADEDWKYAFTKLDEYDDQGKVITYTIEEEKVEGYETFITNFDITNLRAGTTDVTVNKTWKDDDSKNRPDTININLLQNGEFYKEYEVKEANDWELNITDLPKYDDKGKAYEYSVTEHDVPGYTSEVDGFGITNTQTDKKTIEITKTWLDDASKDRPEKIEVELFRSIAKGEKKSVEIYELSAEGKWSLEVEDLPAFDQDGKAYTYEIEEKAVDGYETSVNGFDITNLRVDKTEVAGTKTWKGDKVENRPDIITVHLLQNDKVIDTKEVTAEDDWTYSFTDLEAYDEAGVAYAYTVAEDKVKGYETSVDGFDITNTFILTENPNPVEDPKDPAQPDNEQSNSPDSKPSDEKDEVVKDGELPNTATNLYRILFVGAALLLMGAGVLVIRRVRYN